MTAIDPEIAAHPHDGLVKRFLTRPEAAAVQLRVALPPALVDRLDWPSLRVVPGSYVDPKLRPRHSDILYAVELADTGQTAFVYVVMEHQSTPQRIMAWRLLQYACRVWERFEREHAGRIESLPLLVPLVLYQGPGGWTEPRCLSELLDVPPSLADVFPSPIELTFAVDELTASVASDAHTRDRAVALVEALRTLLHLARAPEEITEARVAALAPLLELVGRAWSIEDLQAILTYVVSAFERRSPLRDILYAAASQETRAVFATIRDEYIAEGKAEGLREGASLMLLRLLERRGFEITVEVQERVLSCEQQERLQQWFDRALEAHGLDEVFDAD